VRDRRSNQLLIVYDKQSCFFTGHRPPHQSNEVGYQGEYPTQGIEKLFSFVQGLRASLRLALALQLRDTGKGRIFRVVVGQSIVQEHFQQRLADQDAAVAGLVLLSSLAEVACAPENTFPLIRRKGLILSLSGIAQTLPCNATRVKLPCAPQCAESNDAAHG